jgi:hypothetical protein
VAATSLAATLQNQGKPLGQWRNRRIEVSRTAEKRKATVNKANPLGLGPAGDSLDDFK